MKPIGLPSVPAENMPVVSEGNTIEDKVPLTREER